MNLRNPIVWARYSARLIEIQAGVVIAAIGFKGATFDILTTGAFWVAFALASLVWLKGVLSDFANTGDLPPNPPEAIAGELMTLDTYATTDAMAIRIAERLRAGDTLAAFHQGEAGPDTRNFEPSPLPADVPAAPAVGTP